MDKNHVVILGIRGLPAQHGGFETFAEYLSLYLVDRNWKVTVYCQEVGEGPIYQSEWEGIVRIHIPVKNSGPIGTILFDLQAVSHSLRHSAVFLTLGYNTAIFNSLHRIARKHNVINMDGIEWKRQKWSRFAKAWFWLNEHFGCWFGNHLVADHPLIAKHLASRVSPEKITMIPYGGREITNGNLEILTKHGLKKNGYAILIARAEAENSILELVKAFSNKNRDAKMVILGNYQPDTNAYHKKIQKAANENVIFTGAIYDIEQLSALRFFARIYLHGHQVGGTNPSLVEALAAGNAVLAHDNEFNRWVARDSAIYFNDISSASTAFDLLLSDNELIKKLSTSAQLTYKKNFQWESILNQYEQLLSNWLPD